MRLRSTPQQSCCPDTQTQLILDATGSDRIFLPSAYHHLILDVPRGNDGLIDIRMAVSRDGGRSAHCTIL